MGILDPYVEESQVKILHVFRFLQCIASDSVLVTLGNPFLMFQDHCIWKPWELSI